MANVTHWSETRELCLSRVKKGEEGSSEAQMTTDKDRREQSTRVSGRAPWLSTALSRGCSVAVAVRILSQDSMIRLYRTFLKGHLALNRRPVFKLSILTSVQTCVTCFKTFVLMVDAEFEVLKGQQRGGPPTWILGL